MSAALQAMGFDDPLAPFGKYSTELGAVRVMKKSGFSDLAAAMDSLGFERIAPLEAWPCDIIALEGEPGDLGYWLLGVALGDNKMLGFVHHDGRDFADTADLFDLGRNGLTAGKRILAWRVAR